VGKTGDQAKEELKMPMEDYAFLIMMAGSMWSRAFVDEAGQPPSREEAEVRTDSDE
jgi:hypothetical protein